MKSQAQIKALIDELEREMELDPSKKDHHWAAIVTLCLALSNIHKPQSIIEALPGANGVVKEVLLWVLSDI